MRELRDIANTFIPSRPVFRLSLDNDHRNPVIEINIDKPEFSNKPEVGTFTPGVEDSIRDIVVENFQETFSFEKGVFSINIDTIVDRSMQDIRNSISNFVEKNLEMRSPTQSKLYKWTRRSMPNSSYFNGILISLYKYLRTFCDDRMKSAAIGSNPEIEAHIKNAIALLEAMEEKYSE